MTAPAETTTPPRGDRRQLDILARQLLAQRSGLESIVLQSEDRPAVKAVAYSLIDQLEAAFAILGALQLAADMHGVAESLETPAVDVAEPPHTFGWRRRAAESPGVDTRPPASVPVPPAPITTSPEVHNGE